MYVIGKQYDENQYGNSIESKVKLNHIESFVVDLFFVFIHLSSFNLNYVQLYTLYD